MKPVTIPLMGSNPLVNPSATPPIPEFQPWTVLLLFGIIVTTAGLLVYFKKRQPKSGGKI